MPQTTLTPIAATSAAGSNGAWTSPQNVYVADALYTSGNISGAGSQTNNLLTATYGFNIPSYGIIDGIQIDFLRYGSVAATQQVSAMKAFALAGTPKAGTDTWPSLVGSAAWVSYGGATDLWGTTWTPADINSTGFGASLSARTTGGGGTAFVDNIRITVYWHVLPSEVPKRYIYKVSNSGGTYLGNLPNVISEFNFSQEMNTAGTQVAIQCAISADTSRQAVDPLTDESGNPLTDESLNALTTEGGVPITSPGAFTTDALIKNGNKIEIWEFGYFNPNGKVVFLGQIERWEAIYGGGTGGDTGDDLVKILCYSDGQDLDNYLVRGNPFTYTTDVSQTSQNAHVSVDSPTGGFDMYGQTFKVSIGVSNISAITLMLSGASGFIAILRVYDAVNGNLLGSTNVVSPATSATPVQFSFSTPISVVGGRSYFFTLASFGTGTTFEVYYQNTDIYANGSMYGANSSLGGGWVARPSNDLYFKTSSGTGSTIGTYTSQDPSAGMLVSLMNDYIGRGGLIQIGTIQSTGLSLSYTFNTNTIFEGIGAVLSLCPNGFYWYVDVGTDTLYLKQASTSADVTLTKGRHLDQINITATIENLKNSTYYAGGQDPSAPAGTLRNIYTEYTDATSLALYGPRLNRLSDNHVTDLPTAKQAAQADVLTHKDEQYQTTVTVVDKTMDTTLLKPGMVVGFNGFGTYVDNLLMQIVRLDYAPEEVTLTLGMMPQRLHPAFEKLIRGLVALQTIANPSTPS